MPFRKVNCISEFNHAAQEVRPSSEALDDAGNLLSPRTGSPKVVSRRGFSGGFSIFNDPDFRGGFRGWSSVGARRILLIVLFIHNIRVDGLLLIRSSQLYLRFAG